MKQLNLVVPGLLGPFSDKLPPHIQQQFNQPAFNVINKCLSKADVSFVSARTYYETLVQLIHPENKKTLSQLTAEYDEIDITKGYFYRADPVHFKAESDHAILIGTELVSPTIEESKQLIKSFNQHFLEDGLSLYFGHPHRWYLKSEKPLSLTFSTLDFSMGRDIKHFMPKGDDALWWRKSLNEAQMLFFQNEVNEARESKGELSINGLWLWDDFAEMAKHDMQIPQQIFSDDVVPRALANQQNISFQSAENINNINSTAVLVLNNLYESVCYGDVDAWLNDSERFFKQEYKKVIELLLAGKVNEINIFPCNGKMYKITKFKLYKFWKKTKTIGRFCDDCQ